MNRCIKILTLSNEFEAKILSEILTEKEIPHIIRSFHDSAYDGLWQSQSGWGSVEAPEEFREEILKIFQNMSVID